MLRSSKRDKQIAMQTTQPAYLTAYRSLKMTRDAQGNVADPGVWSQVHDESVPILENLANIRVPVVAAVEGRAYVHSEYAPLANVIVAGERNERLVHREDEDVTEALCSLFEDEGIDVVLNAGIKRVSGKSGQSVRITIEQNGVEKAVEGTHLLVAAGRTPNTGGIGLELAGAELTDRGYVKVNEAA
jgi:pyruvate/2-oxoglutarate dehydrogenase complex dihydrolipoamide dehydrogenase (E3) component